MCRICLSAEQHSSWSPRLPGRKAAARMVAVWPWQGAGWLTASGVSDREGEARRRGGQLRPGRRRLAKHCCMKIGWGCPLSAANNHIAQHPPHRVERVQQLAGVSPPQAQTAVLPAAGQQFARLGPGQRGDGPRVPRQHGRLGEAACQTGVAQCGTGEGGRAVPKSGRALQRQQAALPLRQSPLHGRRQAPWRPDLARLASRC